MQVYDALTAAELAAANQVVPLGDLWIERDTGYAKRGDGATPYNSLLRWAGGQSSLTAWKRADQSSTDGTNLADVDWLSFPILASGVYVAEYHLFYTAAATTTGLVLSVNGPASPTISYFATRVPTSTTATVYGATDTYDTALVAADTPSTTVFHRCDLEAFVQNGSTAGTLALRFRTEVNASAVTIKKGSWARLTRVG